MKIKAILPAAVLTVLLAGMPVLAAQKITVNVDEQTVGFTDAQPIIIDGRTMVPVRGVFEKMNFSVSWNQQSKTAVLSSQRFIIQVNETGIVARSQISGKDVTVDNSVLPQIVNDRFYMPLRAIAQCSDATVDWDANTKTVDITTAEYAEKLEAIKAQEEYDQKRAAAKNAANTDTSDTEEESGDSAYYNPEGDLSYTDQTYLETVFDGLNEIKQIALDTNDPILMRFYGIGDTSKEIAIADTDYSQVETICNAFEALQPTEALSKVDGDVKNFANRLKLAYQQSKKKKITQTELTKTIGSYAKEREDISLQFSKDLVEYFNSKHILFESVFGEECLDAMN